MKEINRDKEILDCRLVMIFDEILNVRNDIESIKRKIEIEKLNDDITKKEFDINCKKEYLFSLENRTTTDDYEYKRNEFRHIGG